MRVSISTCVAIAMTGMIPLMIQAREVLPDSMEIVHPDTVTPLIPMVEAQNAPRVAMPDSIPDRWTYSEHLIQPLPDEDAWWHNFNDPLLDRLIAMGLEYNYNAAIAIKRMELAHTTLDLTSTGYYPTLGVSAGWNAARSSGYLSDPHTKASNVSYWDLGVSMSWEIDVFGRIKQKQAQAKANIDVSRMDYAAVQVSLAAEIANAYITLRTYQAQLEVARKHIASQERILEMTLARHEAGLASNFDVTQARVVLYSTQSSIPGLEAAIHSTINSISVLVGRFPDEVNLGLSTPGELPSEFKLVGIGVPADLLRRRPDIISAEYQLAADAAALGIAKKDFLPTLTLNGSVGTRARNIGDLFKGDSFTYSIAPTLSWTIFDGFNRRYSKLQARQQLELDIDNYNMTVQTAVEEVDNAIIYYAGILQNIELIEKTIQESNKSLALAVDLYKNSLSPFSNVVDAQLNLLTYQNNLVSNRGKALQSLVNIYKALGGGWDVKDVK